MQIEGGGENKPRISRNEARYAIHNGPYFIHGKWVTAGNEVSLTYKAGKVLYELPHVQITYIKTKIRNNEDGNAAYFHLFDKKEMIDLGDLSVEDIMTIGNAQETVAA